MKQSFFIPHHAPFLEIRTTIDSTLPYDEHFHAGLSIGLILNGKINFSINGQVRTAVKGDIVLIGAWLPHSCNPVNNLPRSYHMMIIEDEWLFKSLLTDITPCKSVIKDELLFAFALDIIGEFGVGNNANNMFIDLIHKLQQKHNCFVSGKFNLHENLSEIDLENPPSVSDFAKSQGLRRDTFSRQVRRKTGVPSKLLHCMRLLKGDSY